MREELVDHLYVTYPDLFTDQFRRYGITVGDGWYRLIEALCEQFVADKRMHEWKMHHEASNMVNQGIPLDLVTDAMKPLHDEYERICMAVPTFLQIKEKFGELRIYIETIDDKYRSMVQLVEDLSSGMCEECGNVGTLGGDFWIKTLCDHHRKERDEHEAKTSKRS